MIFNDLSGLSSFCCQVISFGLCCKITRNIMCLSKGNSFANIIHSVFMVHQNFFRSRKAFPHLKKCLPRKFGDRLAWPRKKSPCTRNTAQLLRNWRRRGEINLLMIRVHPWRVPSFFFWGLWTYEKMKGARKWYILTSQKMKGSGIYGIYSSKKTPVMVALI